MMLCCLEGALSVYCFESLLFTSYTPIKQLAMMKAIIQDNVIGNHGYMTSDLVWKWPMHEYHSGIYWISYIKTDLKLTYCQYLYANHCYHGNGADLAEE